MGMESVELLLKVEDEFGLEISNDEAAKIICVGDMQALVLQKLRQRGDPADETQVEERLHRVIVDQLGVRPEEVTPTARFIEDLKVD